MIFFVVMASSAHELTIIDIGYLEHDYYLSFGWDRSFTGRNSSG